MICETLVILPISICSCNAMLACSLRMPVDVNSMYVFFFSFLIRTAVLKHSIRCIGSSSYQPVFENWLVRIHQIDRLLCINKTSTLILPICCDSSFAEFSIMCVYLYIACRTALFSSIYAMCSPNEHIFVLSNARVSM